MVCPQCMREEFVIVHGDHYICIKKEGIPDDETGCGTQFNFTVDTKVQFPHNVIFNERSKEEFYRKPRLVLTPLE